MGRWIARHKGLFIFLCIFTTLIVLVVGVVACSVNMSKKYLETMLSTETAVVERRSLVESISASGTIVSSDSVSVIARVSGVDINEMYVELGDWVEAGTLICTLDTTRIEENLAIAEANLAANEQSLSMAVDSAQRQYNDAVSSQNQANANAQTSVAEAERTLALAKTSYENACNSYNGLCNELNDINVLIKFCEKEQAESDLNIVNGEIEGLEASPVNEGEEGYAEYTDSLSKANSKKTELEKKVTNLTNELKDKNRDNIINGLKSKSQSYSAGLTDMTTLSQIKNSLETQVSNARISRDSSCNQYNSAQTAYDNAVANAATPSNSTSVASARDNLTSAQTNAEIGTLSAEQQIDSYYEQIENCAVYAPISGLVTAVNCKAGDSYTGAAIITIENTTEYDVETYVSEYDIGKIKVGQEVVVKTNGTGELELEGVVKSIAPRATSSASGVSYKVIVQINTECEGLRLDMTAKLSIILTKAENVVTVPYESVQTDEDGKKYVEISKGKNEATGLVDKEKVYVTTGVESAYYVEITSGDITEGSEVIVPRDEYSALDIYSLLEEEGALGGY